MISAYVNYYYCNRFTVGPFYLIIIILWKNVSIITAPQNARDTAEFKFLDDAIKIFPEINDIGAGGSLYHQFQKILGEKDFDFFELNNFIQSMNSGYESKNAVTEFYDKNKVRIGS